MARRLTKVVFDWRMKSGRRTSACSSALDCSAIAPIIRLALWIKSEMSSERCGQGPGQVRGVDDQPLEGRRVPGQLAEYLARGGKERVQVPVAGVGLLRDPLIGELEALDHVLEVLDRARVEGVEELVEVDLGGGLRTPAGSSPRGSRRPPQRAPAGRAAAGGWRSQRASRSGSSPSFPAERGVGGIDAEGDQGLAVVAEGDVGDRAGGDAGYYDLGAGDELRRILEFRRDGVLAAAEQEEVGDDQRRDRERRRDRDPDRP